jgi:F0F1-type ATP synthase assembly protein I
MQGDQGGSDRRTTGFGTGRRGVASVSTLAGAGIEFAVFILVFLYIGKWLDGRFGTSPVLTIVGVFFGAGGGFYTLYRSLMAAQRGSRKPRDP